MTDSFSKLLKVYTGEANFTIGGYALSEERSLVFAASNQYLQASMGFCYKETFGYYSLTAPLRSCIWMVIFILLTTTITVILLTKKLSRKCRHFIIGGKMNRTPILNMWASLLGVCISNPFIVHGRIFGTFARTLALLWILLWFVVRNSYQGTLYTFLQSHRLTSSYDTIIDFRASDYKVITSPAGYSFLKHLFSRDRLEKYMICFNDIMTTYVKLFDRFVFQIHHQRK